MAYWLLYDVLKEEGLLEQYGFDSLGDDIPYLDYKKALEMDGNITLQTEGDIDDPFYKFREDETLEAALEYIAETYGKHYSNRDKFQTLDFIESLGESQAFCRGNAMKYLSRFDKKGSAKLDILKAIHYCVLLYHFNDKESE